jgi:hypothetical protein
MRDAGACRGAGGAGDAARGLLEAVDAGSAPQTCRGPLPLRTLGGVAYRGRMRQSVRGSWAYSPAVAIRFRTGSKVREQRTFVACAAFAAPMSGRDATPPRRQFGSA